MTDFSAVDPITKGPNGNSNAISKIKITKTNKYGSPEVVVYDLTNANDVGELSTMQASKMTSKTYPSRSQEYQGVDKNASKTQDNNNQFTTSSGITFTVE